MPLVLVPTPLGNLRDITLRAVDELRDCDLVVAEDTRVALRLLSALGITGKSIWSYREQNAGRATSGILERAADGRVALVTDAGTPGISDPGRELVAAAREAGIPVEALPGPTAFISVAVLSGFDLTNLTFAGFPPRTAAKRRAAFATALAEARTSLWYEAPTRIHATLGTLAELAPGTRVFLVREFTKRFEQQLLGTPAVVAAALGAEVRGEIAFALEAVPPRASGRPESSRAEDDRDEGVTSTADAAVDLDRRIAEGLASGEAPTALARRLAREGRGERRALYARISGRKDGGPQES